MRSRILALAILGIFIGIPLLLYWYFMIREESSLVIQSTSLEDFSVQLQGTLEYNFLPLADKFLDFHQECHQECRFSSIPPVKYSIVVSGTGRITTVFEERIMSGESRVIQYEGQRDILTQSIVDNDILEGESLPSELTFLTKVGKSLLVAKKNEEVSSLGFYIGGSYRLARELSQSVKNITLDISKQFILLEQDAVVTILSKNLKDEIEFPLVYGTPKTITRYNAAWKVHTDTGVYEYQKGKWIKNIRFTDYIDMTPYNRIGYIAGDDSEKLSLSNLPSGNGVFVSLDRKTGKSYILRNAISIAGFYYLGEEPAYSDMDGKSYYIKYSK